ncbi:hypothetical protein E1265_17355 [Streptomyces sp. 8K308]|uniref:hypothetical protein n=1 Tax=Streptomyces sp. 8K308 TaxID=2530388 RepID=UPI00105370DF|nr:hypothetical protein [Streptomyces sp. 8K308]TDC21696.1 hypothetical protein E1265_17355 [Streptomyces sp. 8K308]
MGDVGFSLANLEFSVADVERSGWRPWETQEQFAGEIDPADMAETAAVYARAAAEGATAENLAERADAIGAEAGGLDGASLVDADYRIRDTQRDLRPDELEGVPSILVRAMNRALDARDEVFDLVYGTDGVNERYSRHVAESRNEYYGWVEAAIAAVRALPVSLNGAPPSVPVTLPGHGTRVVQPVIGLDGVPQVPSLESWAPEIRQRHLDDAVDDAHTAMGEINDAISQYRLRLIELAGELDQADYAVADGPLRDLWINEGMARATAEGLTELLGKNGTPAPGEVEPFLTGVASILDGVYQEYGGSGRPEAARDLTRAEQAYLTTFYRYLDTPNALGLVDWERGAASEEEAAARREAGERLLRVTADGALTLLNPGVGGQEWNSHIAPPTVPQALMPLTYGLGQGRTAEELGLFTFQEEQRDAEYRGLTNLLSHSTITPGQDLATNAAYAAVGSEWLAKNDPYASEATRLGEGNVELLELAARRPEAATSAMSDPDFARELLEGFYQPGLSEGGRTEPVAPAVSEFVESTTRLPEGVDPRLSAEGRAHADAAFSFLSAVDAGHGQAYQEAPLVRDLATTWGEADPERFGRFEHLRNFVDERETWETTD